MRKIKKSLMFVAVVAAAALFAAPKVGRADHRHHDDRHCARPYHSYGFHYDLGYHHMYSHHYYGLARPYHGYRGFSIQTPGFSLSIGSGYYHHPAFRGHYYRYRGFRCW